jgi:hypothetical protein
VVYMASIWLYGQNGPLVCKIDSPVQLRPVLLHGEKTAGFFWTELIFFLLRDLFLAILCLSRTVCRPSYLRR